MICDGNFYNTPTFEHFMEEISDASHEMLRQLRFFGIEFHTKKIDKF